MKFKSVNMGEKSFIYTLEGTKCVEYLVQLAKDDLASNPSISTCKEDSKTDSNITSFEVNKAEIKRRLRMFTFLALTYQFIDLIIKYYLFLLLFFVKDSVDIDIQGTEQVSKEAK